MDIYNQAYEENIRFERAVLYKFKPIKIPIPFWDSTGGPFDKVPLDAWLELYDENGICGQAPCSQNMKDIIIPLIMTGETKTYEQWYQKVYWAIRNNGFSGEAAVEVGRFDLALHDIMAKRKGLPLHKFLGAKRDWVKVYASGCGTHLTGQQMVTEVQQFIKEGYTTFKMKVATDFGANLDRDIERVRIVRELIGPQGKLAIDANQLWNAKEAYEFARRVENYNIAWLEEPVHSYDFEELEKLTEISPIPIAMGESPRCGKVMYAYIKAGVKQLQPIPSNLSGVRDWMLVKNQARKYNLELTSGGFSHITASFIATADEEDMVEYLVPLMRTFYDIMELRPKEKDGKFYLPSEPGICVSPDFKLLKKMGCIEAIEFF